MGCSSMLAASLAALLGLAALSTPVAAREERMLADDLLAGPLDSWVGSVNSFFDVGDTVIINNLPDVDTIHEDGDYSAFLFGASSFNSSVLVGADSVEGNAIPSLVAQSLSLTIADAVARNATSTASDLIFQSILRQDSAATTVSLLNAMVAAAGCKEPLTSSLLGAFIISEEESDPVIWSLALRNVPADITLFAECFSIVTA